MVEGKNVQTQCLKIPKNCLIYEEKKNRNFVILVIFQHCQLHFRNV